MGIFSVIFHPRRTLSRIEDLQKKAEYDANLLEANSAEMQSLVQELTSRNQRIDELLAEQAVLNNEIQAMRIALVNQEKALELRDGKIEELQKSCAGKDEELAGIDERMEDLSRKFKEVETLHQRYLKRIALLRTRLREAEQKQEHICRPGEDEIAPIASRRNAFYHSPPPPVSAPRKDDKPADPPDDSWYIPLKG